MHFRLRRVSLGTQTEDGRKARTVEKVKREVDRSKLCTSSSNMQTRGRKVNENKCVLAGTVDWGANLRAPQEVNVMSGLGLGLQSI